MSDRPVLLLTARDPLTTGDGAHAVRAAAELTALGQEVTLVLLEDAVTLARAGHRDRGELAAAIEAGVEVLVEEEARSRRAVEATVGVKPTTFGEVVDRLVDARAAWL
jgi:predicted peroxiredoxin